MGGTGAMGWWQKTSLWWLMDHSRSFSLRAFSTSQIFRDFLWKRRDWVRDKLHVSSVQSVMVSLLNPKSDHLSRITQAVISVANLGLPIWGFPKMGGTPRTSSIYFNRLFLAFPWNKPSIWGYPHFWKPKNITPHRGIVSRGVKQPLSHRHLGIQGPSRGWKPQLMWRTHQKYR